MEDLALAEIIRLCVEGRVEKDPAWRELLRRQHSLLRNVIGDRSGRGRGDEFVDWFPGWLLPKLKGFLRRLRSRWVQAEAVLLEEREDFVRNWLACVAYRSARADYYRKHMGKGDSLSEDEAEGVVEDERFNQIEVEAEEVIAAASRVTNQHHRVAFWLRYYRVCGELRSEDEAWVREQCPDADAVIQQGYATAQEREYECPFEAKDIARLMGATHLAKGGQDAVAQWIRRGLKEVQQVLKLAEGNDADSEPMDDQPD